MEIIWLEYRAAEEPSDRWEIVTYETASRNGEPFEALIRERKMLPNPVSRFCTVELKVRTIHRYLKHSGWTEWQSFIGIRADEQRRVAKLKNQDYGKHEEKCAPLAMAGITAKEVSSFWQKQPFDLALPNMNGKTMHGNCDLCFLKGVAQVLSLISEEPDRAVWWAKMETIVESSGEITGNGARFRQDRPSYARMHEIAIQQPDFFGFDDATIECVGCTD
jgi:3'-phosphoadenosine 5'-phosphosulfate sulfotransferase (PAPS reductase)/FAD synthetase